MTRRVNAFGWMIRSLIAILFIRIFFFDFYRVSSDSMQDTLYKDDFILVSKIHFGCRLPITPLQLPVLNSYSSMLQLPYCRIPGFDSIEKGDILAFNLPSQNNAPIDKRDVYVKRCAGLPGDTLVSKHSSIWVNGTLEERIREVRRYYRITSPGSLAGFMTASGKTVSRIYGASTGYVYLLEASDYEINALIQDQKQIGNNIRVHSESQQDSEVFYLRSACRFWDQDNYGPIIVPKKGTTIRLDSLNARLYYDIISIHEGNSGASLHNGRLYINDRYHDTYLFKQDYFFVLGDNRPNSRDSRHWGFLPANHLIGKVISGTRSE